MSKATAIINDLSEAESKISPELVEQAKEILWAYGVKGEKEGIWWNINGGIAGEGMSDDSFVRLGTTRSKFCIHTTSSHYPYTEGMRSFRRLEEVLECLGKLHALSADLVLW